MIWKALESKDGAEGVQMFEPYALIPLAWSSLLIGRIAKGLLSLGQYERMEVWCRATVKNMIW